MCDMGHITSAKNRRTCQEQCDLLQRERAVLERIDGRPASSVARPMLTRREVQVTQLVSQGLANKAIAENLGLREGTVKIHLHNIYQKLQVPNRTALILSSITKRVDYP